MPEEVVTTDDKPVAPALDAEALGKQIAAAAQQAVAQALQAAPQEQSVVEQPRDALADVLEPYVTRSTNRAELIARMASDKADFYTVSDPEELALRLEYKAEIEKRALAMASGGRPLPREDIFKHLKGEKEDEFFEKKSKRKQAREKRALEDAQDHGGDGMPRTRNGNQPTYVDADQAHTMQGSGKLETFLDDKSF